MNSKTYAAVGWAVRGVGADAGGEVVVAAVVVDDVAVGCTRCL